MTLTLDLETSFKFTAHFYLRHPVGEVYYKLHQGEKIYDPEWEKILDNSALILTLDLDTWTKVSFTQSIMRVNLQPDWVKGKKICSWQAISDG